MSGALRELLNVYWLRPETALWRAIDIHTMQDFKVSGNSLDLGSGDGVLSFIRGGGKFDLSFDDYRSIGNLDKFYHNIDIHDTFMDDYNPCILKKPSYKFSVALDHKENLLKKAQHLDFYEDFVQHDANYPLPFKQDSFDSIFSNIIYWLDDPQKSINEIARVLNGGGGSIDVAQ
ncbi:methyltransferase domain-containing protein [Campylobacter sp. 9BO]|uniref:class I SAM-dependent methyltransferase n=1 Tax=Campylobacter sp. 9BO TaxID=3424759 RepID=UPI003D34259F